MPEPTQITAVELLHDLQAQGWTQARIARALGRDSRLLRFVLKGLKPGRNLIPALRQLSLTGELHDPIPRRRTKQGRVARVRGRRGQPSVTPEDPTLVPSSPRPEEPQLEPSGEQAPAEFEPSPRKRRGPAGTDSTRQPTRLPRHARGRNLLRHEVENLPKGRSSHLLRFPRTNEDAREQANRTLFEIFQTAREAHKRMHAKLWIETGPPGHRERQELRIGDHGGYDAGLAADDIGGLFGGSVLDWMTDQAGNRYKDVADTGLLVGVEVDIW